VGSPNNRVFCFPILASQPAGAGDTLSGLFGLYGVPPKQFCFPPLAALPATRPKSATLGYWGYLG